MSRLLAPNSQRRGQTASAHSSPTKRGLTNIQASGDPANPLGNQKPPITPPNPLLSAGTGSQAERSKQAMAGAGLKAPAAVPPPAAPEVRTRLAAAPDTRAGMVSGRAAEIAASDSPLMQWAETAGKQYANERGLINSSIAAGAVGTSVLSQASELAARDVSARQAAESLSESQRQFDNAHGLNKAQLLLQHGTAVAQLGIDQERLRLSFEQAAADLGLRERQFEAGERHAAFGRELEAKKFESAEAQRVWVENMQRKQLQLHEDAQKFQQNLDRDRFEWDKDYRDRALAQAKELQTRQFEIELERIGIDQTRVAIGVKETGAQMLQAAAAALQADLTWIGEMADWSDAQREAAVAKATERYNEQVRLAGEVSGQELFPDPQPDPGNTPEGDGNTPEGDGNTPEGDGNTPTGSGGGTPTGTPTGQVSAREDWTKSGGGKVAKLQRDYATSTTPEAREAARQAYNKYSAERDAKSGNDGARYRVITPEGIVKLTSDPAAYVDEDEP